MRRSHLPELLATIVAFLLVIQRGIAAQEASTFWVNENKVCADGCTQIGNCNGESGTCECPYGLTGPTCEQSIISACGSPSQLPSIGVKYPRNCLCYKQAWDMWCGPDGPSTACEHELARAFAGALCYTYLDGNGQDLPEDQQFSDFPDASKSVTWKQFSGAPESRKPDGRGGIEVRGDEIAFPLSSCKSNCSYHGVCMGSKRFHDARCICHKGWAGESCENADENDCLIRCGGRGSCNGGFCHCNEGFWGLGCARSQAYQRKPDVDVSNPMNAAASGSHFKVYVYDLPMHVSNNGEFDDGAWRIDDIYSAMLFFLENLLRDNVTRTENPWEANLFFVPAFNYYYSGNMQFAQGHMMALIKYLKANYPFWNRHGGRDHVFIVSNDRGTCTASNDPEIQNPIKMVHFGMTIRPHSKSHAIRGTLNGEYGCYNPERDIVIPPVIERGWEHDPEQLYAYWNRYNKGEELPQRTRLLFFSGGVTGWGGDPQYSGGVRQKLYTMLKDTNDTDVLVTTSAPGRISEYMRTSLFCLTPYGHGWAIRTGQAIMQGCIPVVVQDHVYQPFHDILPYEDFTVRIPQSKLDDIVPMLRSYSVVEIDAMREEMSKHYQAFSWHTEHGGMAFNHTIKSMKKAWYKLQGELFRKA